MPFLRRHGKRDRQHVSANSLHEGIGADANIQAGDGSYELKSDGCNLTDKYSQPLR